MAGREVHNILEKKDFFHWQVKEEKGGDKKKKKKPGKLSGPDHEGILKIILSYVHFI